MNIILYTTVFAFSPIFGYKDTEGYINADILNLQENLQYDIPPDAPPIPPNLIGEEYDFIVVGSGSAGSVIANRLSEIENWNVLLLEAGYAENDLAQYPVNAPILQFTDYNWGYTTEPQENICLAMEEQRCSWPRGKALGGSSVINYMAYTRGNPKDYDTWAGLGNPGWAYSDVLPKFLKSEDSHLENSNPSYHNKGGYQSIENSFSSELADAFINAGTEFGYKSVDYNSPQQIGFSKFQATIKFGRRHSAASAFLKPILHRKNLHILTGATVTKVLIDPFTKNAYGVTYDKYHQTFSVSAKKEVIISAGALNSPQILMLSGVGPQVHLEEIGIAPIIDLPVGQTLYDHFAFYGLVLNTNFTTTPNLFDPEEVIRWYTTGKGPLATTAGSEAIAYINTNFTTTNENYPDVELILLSSLVTDFGVVARRSLRISDDYYYKMFSPLEGISSFSILPILLHPKSKGYVKLRSSNPYDYPLFYGNYLTDSEGSDAKTLIAGIRFIIKLSESGVFKRYNVQLNKKPVVGCQHLPYNSDQYWNCALRFTGSTLYHQTSTCKMGPVDDPSAVVNHELKVYGIGRLRVADASIIPLPPSGHTAAPTIMVGEMASDLIKKEWEIDLY